MGRADSLPLNSLPQKRVGLMGVRDFHAIDLDKDEIVNLISFYGRIHLRYYFPHRSCLARAGGSRDVDTGTRAFSDCRLQVGKDKLKGLLPAWKRRGHMGRVKATPNTLVWRDAGFIRVVLSLP